MLFGTVTIDTPSMMKRILVDATIKDINMVIRSAGLVFVRLEWAGDYHALLSRTSGAYIIGGQVNSHPHWVGLNAFKGANDDTTLLSRLLPSTAARPVVIYRLSAFALACVILSPL